VESGKIKIGRQMKKDTFTPDKYMQAGILLEHRLEYICKERGLLLTKVVLKWRGIDWMVVLSCDNPEGIPKSIFGSSETAAGALRSVAAAIESGKAKVRTDEWELRRREANEADI
jgi:hypothetical protein